MDFAIDDPSNALNEACGFIFACSAGDDGFQVGSRIDAEGALIDCLVARVKFGNDEMASRPVGQHSGPEGVMVGAETWEAGKQSVVQIDNSAAGELPTRAGR